MNEDLKKQIAEINGVKLQSSTSHRNDSNNLQVQYSNMTNSQRPHHEEFTNNSKKRRSQYSFEEEKRSHKQIKDNMSQPHKQQGFYLFENNHQEDPEGTQELAHTSKFNYIVHDERKDQLNIDVNVIFSENQLNTQLKSQGQILVKEQKIIEHIKQKQREVLQFLQFKQIQQNTQKNFVNYQDDTLKEIELLAKIIITTQKAIFENESQYNKCLKLKKGSPINLTERNTEQLKLYISIKKQVKEVNRVIEQIQLFHQQRAGQFSISNNVPIKEEQLQKIKMQNLRDVLTTINHAHN